MSTQEQSVTEVIKTTEKVDNGFKITERLNVLKTFKKMSKNQKIAVGCYGISVVIAFCASTYNDGKKALLAHRLKKSNSTPQEEWIVTKEGCSENTFSNVWSAIGFPLTCVTNIFPVFVTWMNGKQKGN